MPIKVFRLVESWLLPCSYSVQMHPSMTAAEHSDTDAMRAAKFGVSAENHQAASVAS